MESKGTIWSYLFKPFRYIAGKESLFVAVGVLAILFVLGYLGNTHYDGALDSHYACENQAIQPLYHVLYQLIAWFSLLVVLYPMAKTFSFSSVRLVDMAGTLATARFPLIFIGLWGLNPDIHICMEGINPFDTNAVIAVIGDKLGLLTITGLFNIAMAIWYIVLLYNAYSVSSNLKGARGGWTFAAGLILSEIISKILIRHLIIG